MTEAHACGPEPALCFRSEVQDEQGRRVLDAGRRNAPDLDSDNVLLLVDRYARGVTYQLQVASELRHPLFNRFRRGHEVIEQWIRADRCASRELDSEVRCETASLCKRQ